jgi:hypothetical protein
MLQLKLALFKLSVEVTFICSVSCDTLHEKLKRTWNMYDQLNWTLGRNSAIESRRPFLSIIKDSIMYATSRECGRCLWCVPKTIQHSTRFRNAPAPTLQIKRIFFVLFFFFKIIMSHILAWHVREVMSAVQSDRGDARSIIIYDSWWETNLFLF